MTSVQEFLCNGGTLANLAEMFAIKARRHVQHPNLVSLKYHQIDSPFSAPIVRECRGIVLDEANGWACVARGFDKFFNHGEQYASPIDWTTARVQEKLDGSLCALYWYAGEWHVATTGTPDASGEVGSHGFRFADLFWSTFDQGTGIEIFDHRARGWTLLFELTAPENRVVVPHHERRLTLLAARLPSGEEMRPEDAARTFFHEGHRPAVVRSFPLGSFEDCAATFATMRPLEQEGYVVVDGGFRRVKVKHPGYVAIHHAKDGLTPRALVDIARKGEVSEVIAAFSELQRDLNDIKARLDALCRQVQVDFERWRDAPTQKDFALAVKDRPHSAALFQMRAGRVRSPGEFYAQATTDAVMRALGMKDAPAGEEAA